MQVRVNASYKWRGVSRSEDKAVDGWDGSTLGGTVEGDRESSAM